MITLTEQPDTEQEEAVPDAEPVEVPPEEEQPEADPDTEAAPVDADVCPVCGRIGRAEGHH